MADIRMPQLGETVTEGTITRWFASVGDTVALNDVLFEVSTDKVDAEVPSPMAGVITELLADEGETVDVGAVLARIESADGVEGAPSEEPGADEAPSPAEPTDAAPVDASPAPPAPAPVATDAGATPPPARPTSPDAEVPASPLVRGLAADRDIDLRDVTATGLGGRVTRADIEAQFDDHPRRSPAAGNAVPGPTGAHAGGVVPYPVASPRDGDVEVPFTRIRAATAEHVVRSLATSAHVATIMEVDYESVDRVRTAQQAAWKQAEGSSLTYLPFIARAVIDALAEHPHLNASVGANGLLVHRGVHLAVAVDLGDEGLIAPVVHDADTLRLRALSRAIRDVADRARAKQLTPGDVSGGTFTLTNNGSFGTHIVTPIINQPQVAVLSTDAVVRKPVVVTADDGTEAIGIHPVGMLSLCWDHRAVDGGGAAAFLRRVKELIETRDWTAELS